MAKVGSGDDDLFTGTWLRVRPMQLPGGSQPARVWLDGLPASQLARFLAVCQAVETSLRSNRPAAGRTEKVKNSSEGLIELKITKPGGTPPHLRAFYIRDGRALWVTHGFTKTTNKLRASDIAEGDSIAKRWRSAQKGQKT